MMVRERLMERMVALLPGVMVVAPLIVAMVVQLHGVMVPVLPKVRVVALLVGIMVLVELQHQPAENLKVGAGKRFMV
jgi:hypothetical protein